MKKITIKKFNDLVNQEVKDIFKSGEYVESERPEVEEAVIEMLDAIYEVVEK